MEVEDLLRDEKLLADHHAADKLNAVDGRTTHRGHHQKRHEEPGCGKDKAYHRHHGGDAVGPLTRLGQLQALSTFSHVLSFLEQSSLHGNALKATCRMISPSYEPITKS